MKKLILLKGWKGNVVLNEPMTMIILKVMEAL
jgi:hypothetical protein